MNKLVLIGRLTRDPDLKYIASTGTAVTNITLAVDRAFKKEGQPEADFIGCVCYGKLAETIASYFTKGRLIAISGRIETSNYEKDNVKIYKTHVIIEDFQFIESKSKSTSNVAPNEGIPEELTPVDNGDIPF